MLRAELHGKLADDAGNATERSEDVLTSNVFGSFRYVPPELALLPFLRLAEPYPYGGSNDLVSGEPTATKLLFWPSVGGRQPDVLIELRYASGEVYVVIVECKNLSGKSQLADAFAGEEDQEREEDQPSSGDQLADYLAAARAGQVRHPEYALPMSVRRTCLLFVPADASVPRKPMEESIAYLRDHHRQDAGVAFYWLSWRGAWTVLEHALSVEADEYRLRLLRDLRSLLDKKGLRPFLGFRKMAVPAPELPPNPRWRHRRSPRSGRNRVALETRRSKVKPNAHTDLQADSSRRSRSSPPPLPEAFDSRIVWMKVMRCGRLAMVRLGIPLGVLVAAVVNKPQGLGYDRPGHTGGGQSCLAMGNGDGHNGP